MDLRSETPPQPPRLLSKIREKGEENHYTGFRWPRFTGTRDLQQKKAKSWIARQRLHVFWEAVHILVALIGIGLLVAIIAKAVGKPPEEPLKVQIVSEPK